MPGNRASVRSPQFIGYARFNRGVAGPWGRENNNRGDTRLSAKGSACGRALPPAATRTLWRDFCVCGCGRDQGFEQSLADFAGVRLAFTYASWAGALYDILRNLARHRPDAKEVILPRYACGTFVFATESAGLTPVYYDIDMSLLSRVDDIEEQITRNTLAVIAVNNVGAFSDLAAIAALCKRNGIHMVEDATYTLGGAYQRKSPAGSVGDAAILNFSEGKAIPVGGGAALINDPGLAQSYQRVPIDTSAIRRRDRLRGYMDGLLYKMGTSRLGYSAYWTLKQLRGGTGTDSEGRMTFEVARRAEFEESKFCAAWTHGKERRASAYLGRIRSEKQHRRSIARTYETQLGRRPDLFLLPSKSQEEHDCHWLRFPVVGRQELSPDFHRLYRFGVTRLYGPGSPLRDEQYPGSASLYDRLFTLPTHHGLDETRALELARLVEQVLDRGAACHG